MARDGVRSALLFLTLHRALSRLEDDPESFIIGSLPIPLQHLIRDHTKQLLDGYADVASAYLLPLLQPRYLRSIECVSDNIATGLDVDVFSPPPAPGSHPVLIFVHGGAWTLGNRRQYRGLGQRLACEGFVAVIVGYPLWPEADAAAQAASVRLVVAHVKAQTSRWGGDPLRIYLSGQSSGANVCAMALLGPESHKAACAGLIGMAGVYDCVAHTAFEARRSLAHFSPMPLACAPLHEHSPALLVRQRGWRLACERVLLLHGDCDRVVPPSSSSLFALALLHAGQPHVEFSLLPRDGHLSFLVGLSLGWRTEPLVGCLKRFCGLAPATGLARL